MTAPIAGGQPLRQRPRRPGQPRGLALKIGEQRLSLEADPRLADQVLAGAGEPAQLIEDALAAVPDRDQILAGLDGQADRPPVALAPLPEGDSLALSFAAERLIGFHSRLGRVADPSLRRIFFQLSAVHELRRLAFPEPADKPQARAAFEAICFKRALGLALLLLQNDEASRRALRLPHERGPLAGVLREDGAFLRGLRASLDKLYPPTVAQRLAAAEVQAGGNIFSDSARFDSLATREKLRVIAAGIIAWYSFIFLRIPRLWKWPLARWCPHYEVAFLMIREGISRGLFFKKGFARRMFRAALRGRIATGVEYFWSGWSPRLARVTLRPFYRLLGGNRRPFSATVGTFLFTALVVHPLWPIVLLVLVSHLVLLIDPFADWTKPFVSPATAWILAGMVGMYLVFGVLAGLAKRRRARQRARP